MSAKKRRIIRNVGDSGDSPRNPGPSRRRSGHDEDKAADSSDCRKREQKKVRAIRELAEEFDKNANIAKEPEVLNDIMHRQDAIIKDNSVLSPLLGMEDGKLFSRITGIVRKNAQSNKFNLSEFALKLAKKVLDAEFDGGRDQVVCQDVNLVKLAEYSSQHMRKSVPSFRFLHPALNKDNSAAKKTTPKKTKSTTTSSKAESRLAPATKVTKESIAKAYKKEDQISFMISEVKRLLKEAFNADPEHRIGFFEFVLDPSSFTNTVENVFFVSDVIVNRGAIYVEDRDTGKPFLQRFVRNSTKYENISEGVNLSVNNGQWKRLVQLLKIQEPYIKIRNRLKECEENPNQIGLSKRSKSNKLNSKTS